MPIVIDIQCIAVSAWCYATDVKSIGATVHVLLFTELPVEEVIWALGI